MFLQVHLFVQLSCSFTVFIKCLCKSCSRGLGHSSDVDVDVVLTLMRPELGRGRVTSQDEKDGLR